MNDSVRQERTELFDQWFESRDLDTRNRLVESYAPLAEFFANRYRNRIGESEDLRQVAQLALVGAVDRFDPEVGVKFSTFAGRTIDGEIKRYFRDKTWAVRVPRSLKERSLEVRKVAERLEKENGRPPTVQDLVADMGIEEDQVIEALNAQATGMRADSLSRPIGTDEEGHSLADVLPADEDQMDQTAIQVAVRSVVADLPEREKQIIVMRFFQEKSQQDIAEEIGVSQVHVSRLLRRTFEQLRTQLA